MSDLALNARGIEADRNQVVAIQARDGFVSVCTRRLPQPLGREEWLHSVRVLIGAGLKVWPGSADDLFLAMTAELHGSEPSRAA